MVRRALFSKWLGKGVLYVLIGLNGVTGALARVPDSANPLGVAAVERPRVASEDLRRWLVSGFEEPLIAASMSSRTEDEDLTRAIAQYEREAPGGRLGAFDEFLLRYPESAWRVSLYTNLGLANYANGYFSRAIDAWHQAWLAGRDDARIPVRSLADRAVGELIRMHARVGHAERVAGLLAEVGDRPLLGSASEAVAGARQGLWMMRNDPGVSYLCGPMALRTLAQHADAPQASVLRLEAYRSGEQGVSLNQVSELAAEAGMAYAPIFREKGGAIPVPSVIHWKVSHYAAIVGERDGRYHIQDPTFGADLWVSRDAIEHESSGYFLVPATQKKDGWRTVSLEEGAKVYGMGFTAANDPRATTPEDDKEKDCEDSRGMCTYNVHGMLVSLNLTDTPVGYRPAVGPAVFVTLTYNQREAYQPALPTFGHVGPKWSTNWLSYVTDDPASAGTRVQRNVAGGGARTYAGYSSATGAFTAESRDGAILVRVAADPIRYERRLADGSIEEYAFSDGAVAYPRRIFLTRLRDPSGNAVDLSYDAQRRLVALTDAVGRQTVFDYQLAGQPLLLTRITDPFGRSASIDYDAQGRLSRITDVLGLTSSFTYNSATFITAMTTPYGTTQFAFGESGTTRWLNITDPLGFVERVEYRHQAPGIPGSDTPVPSGMSINNRYINGRNTFYWDKDAYAQAAGNYTRARIKHWFHLLGNTSQSAGVLESLKQPLERRLWYNTPGSSGYFSGTLDKPSIIGRVMDNGVTQLQRTTYNDRGNITGLVDPLNRETRIDYAANGIDVVSVRQKSNAPGSINGYAMLASYTWNTAHRPLTFTDAAGQTTTYSWNAAGQLRSVTDPLGQTTTYHYDASGNLVQVINAQGHVELALAYDTAGRVARRTDSEGHTLEYEYDALDRLVRTTWPDGTHRLQTWDRLDLAKVTDRLGRSTHYTYDANRRLIEQQDPLGRYLSYGYSRGGRLQALTDGKGQTTRWYYDIQGRLTAKELADGSRTSYAYEAGAGRLRTRTDALGQVRTHTYALDDRLIGLSYSGAVHPTPAVGYTWDTEFARLVSMTDGTGATTFGYHQPGALGALKAAGEDGPWLNDTVSWSYDALGRMIEQRVGSSIEQHDYDALGRRIRTRNDLGQFDYTYLGQTEQMVSARLLGTPIGRDLIYEANAGDRRLYRLSHHGGGAPRYTYASAPEQLIDGIVETVEGQSALWAYDYDAAGRLRVADRSDGAQYDYAYDAADNVSHIEAPGGSQVFAHDVTNRIAQTGYVYDANGNR
ncbi:cysteine peptidase family C39 domain-containing protein, partial [Parazoarcus communis]